MFSITINNQQISSAETNFFVYYTDYVENNLSYEKAVLKKHNIKLVDGSGLVNEKMQDSYLRRSPVIVTTSYNFNADLIQKLEKCQLIIRHGSGYDNIDIEACNKFKIPVVTIPDYCIHEVTEHTVALIFALRRKICNADILAKQGYNHYSLLYPIHRLNGQTAGIIGFGRLGKAMAEILSSLGLNILIHTLNNEEKDHYPSYQFVDLQTLIRNADILTIHSRYDPKKLKLIGKKELCVMKPSAILINTSRSGLLDQKTLIQCLNDKKIAGAALDVYDDSILRDLKNLVDPSILILSPHVAWYSEQSLMDIRQKITDIIINFHNQGTITGNLVNPRVFNEVKL